ncbi:MAG: hypothetical protein WAR37_00670 [Candidatus Microsaccharimonas sp.]
MPKSSKKQSWLKQAYQSLRTKNKAYLERRPHRSFRRTRRRDYARPIELPGYIPFTHSVNITLLKYKKIFLPLIVVYTVLYVLLVGMQSQETYSTLTDTLQQTGGDIFEGNWGTLGKAGVLFLTVASSGASEPATEAQQIFSVLILLLVWLSTVWLLRNVLAGHKVKLRDGIYNSGAPLFSTLIITLIIAVQLIPVALALIGYSAAQASGLLDSGVAAMLFWIAAALLAILSLYWITSSLFAMVIVTLPGMYPFRAIQTAGDLVIGRRVTILLRWLWMSLVLLVAWALLLIPTILFDTWLKSVWPAIDWLPLVPFVAVLLSAITAVWVSAYVYLLYRKVVDYA